MGMFDSIRLLATDPIVCPGCQTGYTEFQTKDLENCLDEYEEGLDNHQSWRGIDLKAREANPRNRIIYAYEWCKQCEGMLYQHFEFDKHGMLSRFRDPYLEIIIQKEPPTDAVS